MWRGETATGFCRSSIEVDGADGRLRLREVVAVGSRRPGEGTSVVEEIV